MQDRSRLLGYSILIIATLAYAAAWGAFLDWRLDLASHFVVQRTIVFGAAAAFLLLGGAYRSAAFAGAVLAVHLAAIVPFWIPGATNVDEGALYRGLTMNLLASNEDRGPTTAYLREADCDFVALQELTPAWSEELDALQDAYPHAALHPREGAFGIGLLSRRPIVSQELIILASASYPTLETRIALEEGETTVIVTHPPPPLGAKNAETRNAHLAALAEHVRTIDGPVLVLGDLNVTPWSPHFRDLLGGSGLRDGRIGHGVVATWPASLGPLGIPIDHVLASPGVDVATLKAGSSLGSDHRSVAFAFRIAKPRDER